MINPQRDITVNRLKDITLVVAPKMVPTASWEKVM